MLLAHSTSSAQYLHLLSSLPVVQVSCCHPLQFHQDIALTPPPPVPCHCPAAVADLTLYPAQFANINALSKKYSTATNYYGYTHDSEPNCESMATRQGHEEWKRVSSRLCQAVA